jgi:hypothetical protein
MTNGFGTVNRLPLPVIRSSTLNRHSSFWFRHSNPFASIRVIRGLSIVASLGAA